MQYHVTCTKCKRMFTITADGSDRMHCTCPYCGQPLMVNLPTMAEPVMSSVQQPIPDNNDNKGHNAGMKILITVLIVLLVGGIAAFAFIEWQNQQEAVRLEEKAQREAHADSLMQVRAQQEAQAADAQRKDAQRQSICKFVKSFYQKAVLEADDPTFYERYLTPYCRQMIFGVDADNNDVDKWSAWWGAFGTTADRPDYEALQRNLNVTPGEGNWYNVRLTQDGTTEYRQIKVSTVDGHVLIDDVR